MKRIALTGVALALAVFTAPASASIIPEGTISAHRNGANFDYTIVLTNNSSTSTDVIGTFWYAWIPGEDFLLTPPSSIVTPANWKVTPTHVPNVATNGYALQWVALSSASAIAPGDSLTFGFTSPDTPSQVFGNSTFFNNPPVGTSFVYHAGPFSDAGVRFTVTSVPEPSTIVSCALGGLGLVFARRRKAAKSGMAAATA